MANVLIGEEPNCKSCTFPICDGIESCTKETRHAIGMWLGKGAKFTVVDTPGFGDSDQDDNSLIDEMMDVLKDNVKKANVLMLLINSEQQQNYQIIMAYCQIQHLLSQLLQGSNLLC